MDKAAVAHTIEQRAAHPAVRVVGIGVPEDRESLLASGDDQLVTLDARRTV